MENHEAIHISNPNNNFEEEKLEKLPELIKKHSGME